MKRCLFCGKKYEESDAFLGFDGFIHCPHCHSPLFDPKIQPADHWCWKYMPDDEEEEIEDE